jgi:hypothetical protein
VHAISLRFVCSAASASVEASRIVAANIVPLLLSLVHNDDQQTERIISMLVAVTGALHPTTLHAHAEPLLALALQRKNSAIIVALLCAPKVLCFPFSLFFFCD